MINEHDDVTLANEDVAELAELTEALSRRLEAGESVSGGDLGDDPNTAGAIRRLLPALQTMMALGEEIAREEGSRARLEKKKQRTPSPYFDKNPEAEEVGP